MLPKIKKHIDLLTISEKKSYLLHLETEGKRGLLRVGIYRNELNYIKKCIKDETNKTNFFSF
jgi:hypothetical protein|tara:strand:- start:414 stop:599 length:186 start_codon:yes stop_codon:yes gene_type:complete